MSLAAGEQRALAQIAEALRRSDPNLAAMLTTFNRVNRSEEMPRREFLLRPTRVRWLITPAAARPDRRRGHPPVRSRSLRASSRSSLASSRSSQPSPRLSLLSRSPGGSDRPHQRRWPTAFTRVLPLIMATCALGLMVVIFVTLGHTHTGAAAQTKGSSCTPTVVMSCLPATGTSGTTVSRAAGAG
jgi:hypothetical protein